MSPNELGGKEPSPEIIEFLKGMRMVLSNATAYFKEHPYFLKSITAFRQKAENLFSVLDPIRIEVAPHALFIDGKYWDKEVFYVELARTLHHHRIKSIEFRKGLTDEELIEFFGALAMPVREALRRGGIDNTLDKEKIPHMRVSALDYSSLLGEEGEESKDIWVYLFKEALDKDDIVKLNELADNFKRIAGKLNLDDLTNDTELKNNICDFLGHLNSKEKDKFYSCAKELLGSILKEKGVTEEGKIQKLKDYFKDFNKDDTARALWEEISGDDNFNYLNFAVFSRLFSEDTHKECAAVLEKKIKSPLAISADIRKKIKEIFSSADSPFIPEFYRHALSWASQMDTGKHLFEFDRKETEANYHSILLNVLAGEDEKERLEVIAGRLRDECAKLAEERNLSYLKSVIELAEQKIKADSSNAGIFDGVKSCIFGFAEKEIFQDSLPAELEFFADRIEKSFLGADFYLHKIFKEGRVNRHVLKIFLKFFPANMAFFYDNLKNCPAHMDFLAKIAQGLKGLESPVSLEILKRIFAMGSNVIKIEALRSMQTISAADEEFAFSILRGREFFLRREALIILSRNKDAVRRALEEFFSIPGFFGFGNRVLFDNIKMVEDAGLKEAGEYLSALAKRRFFWNRSLRRRAHEALEKLKKL